MYKEYINTDLVKLFYKLQKRRKRMSIFSKSTTTQSELLLRLHRYKLER